MPGTKHTITLRSVGADDEIFLFDLFCGEQALQFASLDLLAEQKDQLLRLQFSARDRQYRAQYPDAEFNLVLHNANPIGNFFVKRGPEEFVLIDITLLPDCRNLGIGTALVGDLIDAAMAVGKPLYAHVIRDNPAWQLWQRLGFREVQDDGVYRRIEVPVTRRGQ
jgi:GNAT superfamily N-acetyltransferase